MNKTAEEILAEDSGFSISQGEKTLRLTKGDLANICEALQDRKVSYLMASIKATASGREEEAPYFERAAEQIGKLLEKILFQDISSSSPAKLRR